MADEPKFSFPVLNQGKAAPSAAPRLETKDEPKFSFPQPQLTPDQKIRRDMEQDNQANLERLRGLTFGVSDRAIALLKHGNYDDNLRKIQKERDEYRDQNPVSSIANGLVGGLASGGVASKGLGLIGAKVLPSVANYAKGVGLGPLATRVGQVLAENGIIGETTHQLEQAPGKIGTDVGRGAAFGAAVGLGAAGAGKVASAALGAGRRIGQRVALAAGAVKPENFANKAFSNSLKDQGLSTDEIESAMKYLRGDDLALHGPAPEGGSMPDFRPPVIVADALPKGTLSIVKKGVKSSDRATTDVSEALKNRNTEQGMRLQNNVMDTISPDINGTATSEALQAQREAAAKPFYEKAYSVGTVDNPIIDDWINDRKVNGKLFQSLEQNLKDNASKGMGNGRPMQAKVSVDPDGNFVFESRPSIEDLDTMKKAIDSKITDMWNPTKNQFNLPKNVGDADAQQLMNQRNDLIDVIDQLTPDGNGGSHYASARNAFADNTQLIDAHRAGQSVMRTRPEDVAKQFDQFSGKPELQDQYRAGVSSAINDLVDKADTDGGAAIVRKMYGSKGIQQKLNYVMANDPTRQLFNRNMGTEKVMVDTQKELTPRSGPSDLLSDAEGFSLPLAAAHALSGRLGSAANQLGRFGTGAIGGMAPEVGDQLAKIAMMSPEEFSAWNAAQKAAQNTFGNKAKRVVSGLGSLALDGVVPALSGEAGRITDEYNSPPIVQDDGY